MRPRKKKRSIGLRGSQPIGVEMPIIPESILQALVTYAGPALGYDYATIDLGSILTDFWFSCDFAVNNLVISDIAANAGVDENIIEFSKTTPPSHSTSFGPRQYYGDTNPNVGWAVENTDLDDDSVSIGEAVGNTWYHLDFHIRATLSDNYCPEVFIDGVNLGFGPSSSPNVDGVRYIYLGQDQIFYPNNDHYSWFKNIKVGTSQGGSDILNVDSATLLDMIANGVGDHPADALSIITSNPF